MATSVDGALGRQVTEGVLSVPGGFPDDSSINEPVEAFEPDDSPVDSSTTLAGKRRPLKLGKKKEGDQAGDDGPVNPSFTSAAASEDHSSQHHSQPSVRTPTDDQMHSQPQSQSPPQWPAHTYTVGASSGHRVRSASPRLHSPASSQIFERNVQESTILPSELSPAIPNHIQTEDLIPPVLEASSLAITDDHLSPDAVEIVTHAAHQPAAATVVGGSGSDYGAINSQEHSFSFHESEEQMADLPPLDSTEIRRLSFISFADVVQGEHVDLGRDSGHLISTPFGTNRSPSPVRSPASSHGLGTTPPLSGAASMHGMDFSNTSAPRAPGSPTSHYHGHVVQGDLTVETMRQALRKTGSGDLSGTRSQPLSPVSRDEASMDHAFR